MKSSEWIAVFFIICSLVLIVSIFASKEWDVDIRLSPKDRLKGQWGKALRDPKFYITITFLISAGIFIYSG